jgi:hypothetical protein
MNNQNGIKLKCNFCQFTYFTDELYLITKGRRDFLVCEYHNYKRRRKENEKSNSKRNQRRV